MSGLKPALLRPALAAAVACACLGAASAASATELTASDGATGDAVGTSVALSGTTVVVGAPNHAVSGRLSQGVVYVFVKPKHAWPGALRQVAELQGTDGAASDNFGASVAISGSTIVVGAPNHQVGANGQQGAVYVFNEPKHGWANTLHQSAELTATGGAVLDALGTSVGISGTTVVAGAPNHANIGAVYAFNQPKKGWKGNLHQRAALTPSGGASGDEFGQSLSLDSGLLAVGAPNHAGTGAGYVFVEPKRGWHGTAHQRASLTATGAVSGDSLGTSIAVSGTTIVAGAPYTAKGGSAYVFVKPAKHWSGAITQHATLTASAVAAGVRFGAAVAISGDTAVVGAQNLQIGSNFRQGAAYVYVAAHNRWSGTMQNKSEFVAPDGGNGDQLGQAVAISGTNAVAGAPGHTVASQPGEGAAYRFGA